ncbi:MAG: biotin/lipoyl-binding protein [Prolixibacteraceae bacterium]|nr:biotin/lipoyl-binding protein [Prolixibacteraceae bacterium]
MEDNKPKYEIFVVNTAQYYTLLTKKFGMRKKWQPADLNQIRSFIPGTILEVYVKPGQEVQSGDKLLKYEAMKMQTILEMPFAGTVKEVLISVGDKVHKDQLMIQLEELAE